MTRSQPDAQAASIVLPSHRDLFYGGAWHAPAGGRYAEVVSPGDGRRLADVAVGTAEDVDAAVAAARQGFRQWRDTPPMARARTLKRMAEIIRAHAHELALLDAADSGNPVTAMLEDANVAAARIDFFAGLVSEMKGDSIPMGPGSVNFSIRQPWGVVARIVAFNHPFMFSASKLAAPLAAGNAVIIKPAEQAPLSSIRLAELVGDLLPPGVFSLLTGGQELGAALTAHAKVAMVGLVGSVGTGRAVMRAAADTLKPVLLELGGKNALIAFPDTDPEEVADAAVAGMNFAWCGQSCGSTSRLYLHDDIHDAVLSHLQQKIRAFKPGLPTDPATTMGAIINARQCERILDYIESGIAEGARLVAGGGRPTAPELACGFYIEPTIFTDVTADMRIAREEIFGPVLSVLRWRDEASMLEEVNGVEYGLTCAIYTRDLNRAHRVANQVEAGYVWINEVSKHFLGAPFGGAKQSGLGREECLGELLAFTQEKNIHIKLRLHS
ncbi:MAG: aldehyde dehydrogenase family protein [Pigmentiphaga sp.]|uniref:aldehyde dehydrogenase family protein n=1 Tax=Pigmentiphaga sp. TaxID=1977564 RepID=UPI0029B84A7C|nr:aldehyde dehydrogenase family protein [Pigmentiphaga sp.]MDX3907624.1 aldehyde dehydrogenase family protein [Pigmentiphaga sp.]